MIITHRSIPKITPIDDTFLFGSQWEATISHTDRLNDIVLWCYENYGNIPVNYYRHGWDKWTPVEDLEYPPIRIPNNKNDYLRIRFNDDMDYMAFKLAWME